MIDHLKSGFRFLCRGWRGASAAIVLLLVCLGWRYLLPHDVVAVRPGMRVIASGWRGAGELAARNQARFSSKTALHLKELRVDTGDLVRRGQTLAVMDATELEAQAAAADATVESARATLAASRLSYTRLQSVQQHAQAEAERSRELARLGRDAISANDLEASELSAKTAALDARVAQAQAQAAEQALRQATKDLEAARARVSDSRFVAPFAGLVTSRQCSVGDTLAPGNICLTVTELETLYVSARFDESVLSSIRVGDSARIYLKSQPSVSVHGRVDRINRNVDPDTREFTVDIAFASLPPGWAIGERATVAVSRSAAAPVLAVPRGFIAMRNGRPGVWTEHNGRAAWTAVKTGAADDGYVEIGAGLDRTAVVLAPGKVFAAQRVSPQLGGA